MGLEFGYKEIFLIEIGAYKFDVKGDSGSSNIETGLSGGVTFDIPVSKESDTRLGVDYSYRQTRILGGTHDFWFENFYLVFLKIMRRRFCANRNVFVFNLIYYVKV